MKRKIKLKDLTVFSNSIWKVKVSLNVCNPPFWALLMVGFVTDNDKPSSYTKLVGTDIDEIGIEDLQGDDCLVEQLVYVGMLGEDG